MLQFSTYDISHMRELATLISHAGFKRLSSSSNQSAYIRKMKKYVGWDRMEENKPQQLGELIAHAYTMLERNYRCEYLYKNKLLNDYVLRYYALEDTILLNEFRIGQSVADAVLINGTNKVFEIKTELDSPERLKSQIQDYYKAFTQVYLFTHSSLLSKYEKLLPEKVGILIYGEGGEVLSHRVAEEHTALLDVTFMMASLRKSEYCAMLKQLVGFVPDVTPAFFYRSCLDVLRQLPAQEVNRAYCQTLKRRIDIQTNNYLSEQMVPSFLNFSFYQQKFNKKSYLTMVNNLSKNLL